MSDWRQVSLSEIVTRVTTKNTGGAIGNVLTVSAEHGLIAQESFFTKKVASKDTSDYYVVAPGQFVYNKSTSRSAPYGTVARNLSDEPGVVSPLYFVFEAKQGRAVPEYLELVLNSDQFFNSLSGMLREGARAHGLLNVRLKEFYAATFALPPASIQERIVEVISAIDGQITALDAEADALEQALDVWISAQFSAAYQHVRLGDIADVQLGKMLSKESASGPHQAPYIRNADVQWQGLNLADLKTMTFGDQDRRRYSLRAGDILSCEGGDPGRSVILSEDLDGIYYQKAVHRVRATGVDPHYLYVALKYCYASGGIAALCTVTTIKHLTAEKYRTLHVPLIGEKQQVRVVEAHNAGFAQIAALRAEIGRLRQTRAGLLSALLQRVIDIKCAGPEG